MKKKHSTRHHSENCERADGIVKPKKSLGALYKAKKTKPRSPEMTGPITLQRHTLEAIVKQLKSSDADEVACNIAAWQNTDKHGQKYLTVELSPRFEAGQRIKPKPDILDSIFDEDDR
jgi:hypothetical protein